MSITNSQKTGKYQKLDISGLLTMPLFLIRDFIYVEIYLKPTNHGKEGNRLRGCDEA
jgi:hypothetical protein